MTTFTADSKKANSVCSKSPHRPEIDGLRALAIVAVIINHFNKDILPSGYLGVDIFFVISGFVITSSLASRPSKNLGDFLMEFYTRRIKRLVPALVLFVAITSILICLFNPDPSDSLKVGKRALFGLSNITLYSSATDYFAASTELNVFTHTWSLGVEEQFYLLFPFIYWFSSNRLPARMIRWLVLATSGVCIAFLMTSKIVTGDYLGMLQPILNAAGPSSTYLLIPFVVFGTAVIRFSRRPSKNLFVILLFLSISSLVVFIYLYQIDQPAAYFLMPTRLWELGTGCLLFLVLKHQNGFLRSLKTIPPLLVTAGIVGVLFIPLQFAVQANVAVVVLTSVLIACLRSGTGGYDLFTRPRVVYIGLISYSLYLWHWGVLSLSRWTIGIHWWSVPFQVALMLLISVVSYRFVETPLRRSEWSTYRWKSISYGLGLSFAGSVLLFTTSKLSSSFNLDTLFPSKLHVLLKGRSNWGKEPDKGCHLSHSISKLQLENCLVEKSKVNIRRVGRIFLIGDSHANQYVSSLQKQMPEYSIRSFTIGWGCGYLQEEDIKNNNLNSKIDCSLYNQLVSGFIHSNLRAGDIVILGHRWAEKKNYRYLKDSFYKLAGEIAAKDSSLVLIDDVAELGVDDPLICERRWWRPFPPSTCYKSLASVINEQSRQDEMQKEVANKSNKTYFLSLRTLYCSKDDLCGPYLAGVSVYSDGSHLTEEASAIGSYKLKILLTNILSKR